MTTLNPDKTINQAIEELTDMYHNMPDEELKAILDREYPGPFGEIYLEMGMSIMFEEKEERKKT